MHPNIIRIEPKFHSYILEILIKQILPEKMGEGCNEYIINSPIIDL